MIADILHPVAGMAREEEQPYRPRPSMAGPERCIKAMTYWRIGQHPDKQMADRFIHVLNDSSWHEELTAEWISKTAFTIHSRQMVVELHGAFPWMETAVPVLCEICTKANGNVPVYFAATDLHGHIDGIVTDLVDIDRLLEHKAINHFTFEGYWGQKEYPEDYFTQAAIYLRALHALLPDITESVLLIKNKNTSGFIEYLLRYDFDRDHLTIVKMTRHTGESVDLNLARPNVWAVTVEKFLAVEAHARAGTLPDRPYTQDHWRCRYCSFLDTCWKDYKEEVDRLAESVDLEPELADKLRYYQQLGAEIKEQEDERRGIGKDLITILKSKAAKKGMAGEYIVSLVVQERGTIDWDAVPLLIQTQLDSFRKTAITEFIKVSKQKLKG